MRAGDVVLAFAGTKQRPAVVMRLVGDRVVVMYGSGTEPPDPAVRRVRVDPSSRSGKAMRLEKVTFFAARSVAVVSTGSLVELDGPRCPPGTFLQLAEIMGLSIT